MRRCVRFARPATRRPNAWNTHATTADHSEAVQSFIDKRKAVFKGQLRTDTGRILCADAGPRIVGGSAKQPSSELLVRRAAKAAIVSFPRNKTGRSISA